ncbi:hypothetical protein [Pseudanabaena cinerea]|nr:hypothetical protein [Pseudanabaena cinerea]
MKQRTTSWGDRCFMGMNRRSLVSFDFLRGDRWLIFLRGDRL